MRTSDIVSCCLSLTAANIPQKRATANQPKFQFNFSTKMLEILCSSRVQLIGCDSTRLSLDRDTALSPRLKPFSGTKLRPANDELSLPGGGDCADRSGRLPQELGGLLGWSRVDVETRAPFESRQLGELRHNFEVPVVIVVRRLRHRRGVDDIVVSRMVEDRIQPTEHILQEHSQLLKLPLGGFFKGGVVELRDQPDLKRKARGER